MENTQEIEEAARRTGEASGVSTRVTDQSVLQSIALMMSAESG